MSTLVDANILLDIITEDAQWMAWSADALSIAAAHGDLVINPIIYAEVSLGYDTVESLDQALQPLIRLPLPYAAGFLAGRCYLRYRRAGGTRRSPLPDFYIGAHAAIEEHSLLTRDRGRYRSYFPRLHILSPPP